MSDPFLFREIELLLIVAGGIFFGYLGYKLFIFGATKGSSKFEAETPVARFVFSGSAPGLFFMMAGVTILVTALLVQETRTEASKTNTIGVIGKAKSALEKAKEDGTEKFEKMTQKTSTENLSYNLKEKQPWWKRFLP